MSTRAAALLFAAITVFTVSCAQPGTALPSSPSSVSAPSAAAAGPGADYNATGTWRFVSTDSNGETEDPFDSYVTQDGNGNLHFLDEDDNPITLERLGTGVIITYRLATIGSEGGDCDLRIKGTVRLDTTSNTLTGNVRLKELGCENGRLGAVVTGTRLN